MSIAKEYQKIYELQMQALNRFFQSRKALIKSMSMSAGLDLHMLIQGIGPEKESGMLQEYLDYMALNLNAKDNENIKTVFTQSCYSLSKHMDEIENEEDWEQHHLKLLQAIGDGELWAKSLIGMMPLDGTLDTAIKLAENQPVELYKRVEEMEKQQFGMFMQHLHNIDDWVFIEWDMYLNGQYYLVRMMLFYDFDDEFFTLDSANIVDLNDMNDEEEQDNIIE